MVCKWFGPTGSDCCDSGPPCTQYGCACVGEAGNQYLNSLQVKFHNIHYYLDETDLLCTFCADSGINDTWFQYDCSDGRDATGPGSRDEPYKWYKVYSFTETDNCSLLTETIAVWIKVEYTDPNLDIYALIEMGGGAQWAMWRKRFTLPDCICPDFTDTTEYFMSDVGGAGAAACNLLIGSTPKMRWV